MTGLFIRYKLKLELEKVVLMVLRHNCEFSFSYRRSRGKRLGELD